jgi:hypothetical protein
MKLMMKVGIGAMVLLAGGVALAQESEFQDKMQEDLDSYKKRIIENCGTTDKLTIKFAGKLGQNPRETGENYTSVGTLCTSALDATSSICQGNKVVKKAFSKLTSIVCTKGKGTMSYSLKGGKLTFMVDGTYDKNNASGQQSDLDKKIRKDLDN